jgi:glycosyltransferase involved in cell wall biosynthesis
MRVLHLGNLVNNGYLNAKLLRRSGVEADVVCDERHVMSQPEWEETDLETPDDHYAWPPPARDGWRRPEWVLPVYDPLARRRYRAEYWLAFRRRLLRNAPAVVRLHRRLRGAYAPLERELGSPLVVGDVVWALRFAWFERLLVGTPIAPLLRRYDVVQAYAAHPVVPLVAAPGQPLVAFEHGTLREIPFEDTPRGRLMSLAYLLADRVLVTNADVIESIRRLGLGNYVFVPHPIDETKYRPGPSELGRRLREEGAEFVVFSPVRHDWHEKGNEVVLRAFAELVRRDRPGAVLILAEWGAQIGDSKQLIAELGIEANVRWLPLLSKPRLLDAYRGADVVLDQFVIGTFGGIAPEAMACERPVVMAFDSAVHRWCFPELPPILPARAAGEIYAHLRRLADDPDVAVRIGRRGRAWIERHYGAAVAVERHVATYEHVLARRRRAHDAWPALSV